MSVLVGHDDRVMHGFDGDVKVINVSKKIGSLMAHGAVSVVKINICVIIAAHKWVLSVLTGRTDDSCEELDQKVLNFLPIQPMRMSFNRTYSGRMQLNLQ